jgi:hypothetical protein
VGEASDTSAWWRQRWRGQPNRLEVWYATCTDAATGTGVWVHGETVAPADGGEPYAHGWIAVFPPDGPPTWERTPRTPVERPARGAATPRRPPGFTAEDLRIDPSGSAGQAGSIRWDLHWDAAGQRGLATFPRWAWDRELLPAAQVVPAPSLRVHGTIDVDGTPTTIDGPGAAARIYGHGNAKRWGWLHAELGGGDVLEVVSAVSTRPGLRALPPLTFLKLRLDGADWPEVRLASFGLKNRLALPTWTIRGRAGGDRLELRVDLPPDRCVAIPYTDPDGATATCTNTERADLDLRITRRDGTERRWHLDGTAHAEVGTRP